MKVMVIGGGGREHAIIKAIKKNPDVETIYALPGNGGIAADAVCVPIGAKEIDRIAAFAEEQAVDFAIVAPDARWHLAQWIGSTHSASLALGLMQRRLKSKAARYLPKI